MIQFDEDSLASCLAMALSHEINTFCDSSLLNFYMK